MAGQFYFTFPIVLCHLLRLAPALRVIASRGSEPESWV